MTTYVDASVQTSPPPPPSPHFLSSPTLYLSHSRRSSRSSDHPPRSDLLGEDALLKLQMRLQNHALSDKKLYLHSYRMPSRLPCNTHITTPARIVSLPNAVADGDAQEPSATPRSVSMPILLPQLAPPVPIESKIIKEDLRSFSTVISCDRLSSTTPDMPHTPSPPSTPDSVEIIENSVQLPDSFLKTNLDSYPEDDGFLTWASSPPRPIPALHGPASLPYARCPSGAEGTVLEEQGNVPHLIWGLGDDPASTTVHSRSLSGSLDTTACLNARHDPGPHRRPSDFNPHVDITPVPPQVMNNPTPPLMTNYAAQRALHPDRFQVRAPKSRAPEADSRLSRQTKAQTPFAVLEQISRDEHLRSLSTQRKLQDFTSRAINAGIHARPSHAIKNYENLYTESEATANGKEIKTRLQLEEAIAFHHQNANRLEQIRRKISGFEQKTPPEFLKASNASFVPTQLVHDRTFPSSAYHPQSRVHPDVDFTSHEAVFQPFTSPLSSQSHLYTRNSGLQRQPSSLPTPPNSSSPLWSPNMPSHPRDLLSDWESCIWKEKPSSHDTYTDPLEELSSQLRQFVCDRILPNDIKAIKKTTPTSLAPPAVISSSAPVIGYTNPRSSTEGPARMLRLANLNTCTPKSNPRTSTKVSSIGPPPSIPLPPVPTQSTIYGQDMVTNDRKPHPVPNPPADRFTLSSGSSNDLKIGLARPRSIPLTRLIKRRLASVPEEDVSAIIDQPPPRKPLTTQQSTVPLSAPRGSSASNSTKLTSPSIFRPATQMQSKTTSDEITPGKIDPQPTKLKPSSDENQVMTEKTRATRRKRTRGRK